MNTTSEPVVSEELLQRFLDGELDREQYFEVQERIEQNEDARMRFEQLRQLSELVAGYNRGVLCEPVPERLKPRTGRHFPTELRRIAAGIVLIGLGALIGWSVHDNENPAQGNALIGRAVAAHELYTREVLHAVEVGADSKEHLGKWLSKRLGVELTIPDLSDFDYALLGGRLLPGPNADPNAMLLYQKPDGSRLSVYIVRSSDPEHAHTRYARESGMDVFYWRDEELSCAVVAAGGSATDLNALRRLSDSVYRQIEL